MYVLNRNDDSLAIVCLAVTSNDCAVVVAVGMILMCKFSFKLVSLSRWTRTNDGQ
jgi:hypothetical protein